MTYYRWGINADIELLLTLLNPDGTGAQGAAPEVSIRRHRSPQAALDNKFWNGVDNFVSGVQWLPMVEFDSSNNPGLYTYLFEQSGLMLEQTYLCYFRNTASPRVAGSEYHVITREVPMVGLRQITVHLRDADSNPIPEGTVSVYTSDNALFLSNHRADANGDVVLSLNDGTYKLRIARTFYSFTLPETLVVTADAAVTYTGTSEYPTITPDPDLCTVFGEITDAQKRPIAGLDVDAYALTPQVNHGIMVGDHVGNVRTDAAGRFQMPLYRNLQVHFTVQDTAFDFDRTVPDAASQDVSTWT